MTKEKYPNEEFEKIFLKMKSWKNALRMAYNLGVLDERRRWRAKKHER